jgi:PIN domain nuclease of toxin-antitoxin system
VRLLLDTHVFLWFLAGDARLRASIRGRIENKAHDKFLSVASVWEMAIKVSLGKLKLKDPLGEIVDRGASANGITVITIAKDHAVGSVRCRGHRDPFDRLLRRKPCTRAWPSERFDAMAFSPRGSPRERFWDPLHRSHLYWVSSS